MKKIKRFLGRSIYLLASKLPESFSSVNVGQRALRAFCGRLILTKCGKKVNIEKNAVFASTVEIGDNSGLGINCRIAGKAIIGKNVMMGPNVSFYPRNHAFDSVDIPMCEQGFSEEKTIIISDDVWIGANSIILGGVTVGKGAIIGAGTVVTKDVPRYAIVCGNPAVVKKYRKESGLGK